MIPVKSMIGQCRRQDNFASLRVLVSKQDLLPPFVFATRFAMCDIALPATLFYHALAIFEPYVLEQQKTREPYRASNTVLNGIAILVQFWLAGGDPGARRFSPGPFRQL